MAGPALTGWGGRRGEWLARGESPARFKNTESRAPGLFRWVGGARCAAAEGPEAARPAGPDRGPGPLCPPPLRGPQRGLPERRSLPGPESNNWGG